MSRPPRTCPHEPVDFWLMGPHIRRPGRGYRLWIAHEAEIRLLPIRVRRMIRDRQDRRCFYCDEPITYGDSVLDHLVPRWCDGGHGEDNRVAACRSCDEEKADRLPTLAELSRQDDLRQGQFERWPLAHLALLESSEV